MASMYVSSPRPWTARCRMVNGSSFMQGIAERHAVVSRCAMAPRIGPSFGARFVSLHQRRYIAFESELHGRRSVATGASRRGKSPSLSEADLYAAEAASAAQPSGSSSAGMPWYGSLSIGLGAVLIVLRGVKAVARRRNSSLEERGFKRGGVADEAYYDKIMKGVRTVNYDGLSQEQMEAARRRRRQELSQDAASLDLDQIELPENHPFAVKQDLSKEEEELQKLRLSVRRGLSPEDMRLLREQQAIAEQMERDQERQQ